MAKAPGKALDFDGAGSVWFKIYEITGIADPAGVNYMTWPAESKFRVFLVICVYPFHPDLPSVTFRIPKNLPTGEYAPTMDYQYSD